MSLLFLRDSDVVASLSPAEVLESQRTAYRAVVDGRGVLLSSAHADDPATGALMFIRSGRVTGATGLVVKTGMVQPLNPNRGLPTVQAMVMLFDSESGPAAGLYGRHDPHAPANRRRAGRSSRGTGARRRS